MARHNDLIENGLLIAGIELYTGKKICELLRHADPNVPGAMALRARTESNEVFDFVIDALAPALLSASMVDKELCECCFNKWPPSRTDRSKFF